jgi:hypothetical protein
MALNDDVGESRSVVGKTKMRMTWEDLFYHDDTRPENLYSHVTQFFALFSEKRMSEQNRQNFYYIEFCSLFW